MKIVIAPDSFKDCLSAEKVANTIKKGLLSTLIDLECLCVPVADGGEGTMSALVAATQGKEYCINVTGPLGRPVEAKFAILGDKKTAVIEMAQASGIELLSEKQLNPLLTTSYGTGELIKAALNHQITEIIVAIGGSATNDGGAGMMQALGVKFLDAQAKPIKLGGGGLAQLAKIDTSNIDARLAKVKITAACDVDNPLIGKLGASVIFGPQKGADLSMVKLLDSNLTQYAKCIEDLYDIDVRFSPGAGAAGGMGAALIAFMNARLQPGIDLVLQTVNLKEKLAQADLVITGEGQIDNQTLHGKTAAGVAKLALQFGIPTIVFAGSVAGDMAKFREIGIQACFSVVQGPTDLPTALANGEANLFRLSQNVAGIIKTFHSSS